jgi:hypothetical protein
MLTNPEIKAALFWCRDPKALSLARATRRSLVLTEHAGELFTGERACGSDAGFEEALAAK